MQKTILVIGGTGTLGQPAARQLNEDGFRVRIMTRDHHKASRLFDDSFEIFSGDPMDPICVEAALQRCQGVHISLPAEVEQQVAETVAKEAARHGVERLSYISGATVAEETRWFPMVNRKFLAEKAIRESGIPYTIFCPTWVMESLPMFVNQGRAYVFGKQPHPYHWVAAENIAGMVSTAYGRGEPAGQRLIVHGPEAIRMHEALKRYCAVFQPDIQEVSTMPFWLVTLLATLTRNRELQGAGELMSYFEKVGEGCHSAAANGLLSAAATTLDTWLERRYLQIHRRANAGQEAVQSAGRSRG
jgi:uncharacterized protein YbjT (DUF2867 family)